MDTGLIYAGPSRDYDYNYDATMRSRLSCAIINYPTRACMS
jgi:hypothetical protein